LSFGLPVSEAARRLGVNQARIRALIAAGQLRAEKVGGRRLVDPASVDRRESSSIPTGRPLSAANAWGLLWVAAGMTPDWLSPWAMSRVRRRLRDDGIVALVPRLRNRATVHRFRAHPSDVERLAGEGRLVRTGVSAARDHGRSLVTTGMVEVYSRHEDLQRFVEKYALIPNPAESNVLVRVVDRFWPFEADCLVAPASVVGVDLMVSGEARTSREGLRLLERLEAQWSI